MKRPHLCASCGVLWGESSWCTLCCSRWSRSGEFVAFSVSQESRQGEDALCPNELLLMGCCPWNTHRGNKVFTWPVVVQSDQQRATVSCSSWCWNLSATLIWRQLLSTSAITTSTSQEVEKHLLPFSSPLRFSSASSLHTFLLLTFNDSVQLTHWNLINLCVGEKMNVRKSM